MISRAVVFSTFYIDQEQLSIYTNACTQQHDLLWTNISRNNKLFASFEWYAKWPSVEEKYIEIIVKKKLGNYHY